MDVRICDICKTSEGKIRRYYFPEEVLNKTEHRTDYKHVIVDLCPKCEAAVLTSALVSIDMRNFTLSHDVLVSFHTLKKTVEIKGGSVDDYVSAPWRKIL